MLVSIIIPAYNAETTLERTLNNVLDMDVSDMEIILVDNNSTDGTSRIIKNAAEKNPGRVRSLTANVQGVSPARNVGLQQAKGKWIQFLDADDTLASHKISYQLDEVAPDTQWIIGGYSSVMPDGMKMNNIPHKDPWKGLVFKYQIGCTHANLFRKSALEAVGSWDESLPDNTDPNLHFELLKSGLKYQIVPNVLSFYHQHPSPNRLSTKAPVAGNLRRIDLLERINAYLRANRPKYWLANESYFLAALLRALRILATHDLKVANEQLVRLRKKGKVSFYLPDQTILSQKILSAYRIGGFRNVECIRLLLAKALPSKFKEWLKR